MPSNTRAVAVALATVLLIAPVVGAATAQSNGFVALDGDSTTGSTTDSPTPAAVSQSESGSGSGSADGTDTNYTRLYVDDEYRSLELKPGESETFEVTIENGEDGPVEVTPGLFVPKVGDRPVEKGWISIDPGQTTLEADAEQTVTVTVSVPEDAELGEYRGAVQFTDETIQYPGRPPRPVHAASFRVRVQRDPTVFVLPLNRGYTQIEAGETYTHSVRINNTGESAVPLDPTLQLREDRHRPRAGNQPSLDRSWFTIDAPSQVPAGGSATVDVTVEVPEDASRGDYDAELDLGLRDPARNERRDYWQQIHMGLQVWKQPDQPFTKTFDVEEGTESVTVELSASDRRNADDEPASFDVTLVRPNGETVEPERVETTNRGYVDLSGDRRRYRYAEAAADSGSAYADQGGERVVRYRLDSPEDGEWELQVMPRDTVRFRYEILRNESTESDE